LHKRFDYSVIFLEEEPFIAKIYLSLREANYFWPIKKDISSILDFLDFYIPEENNNEKPPDHI